MSRDVSQCISPPATHVTGLAKLLIGLQLSRIRGGMARRRVRGRGVPMVSGPHLKPESCPDWVHCVKLLIVADTPGSTEEDDAYDERKELHETALPPYASECVPTIP